ncbi:MAG: ABC transporter ATP-binding protein [Actinomycetota bacterium]
MSAPPPLEIRGLTKAFDDVLAVDRIDLTLTDNELLALVGPSGCGKSTLLRMIAGLVAADSGTIELSGRLVEDGSVRLPPERRPAGLVFQEHALFPHLCVRDNVGFGVRGRSKRETAARVGEMLELVSLADHGDRYPHELSGGERQRVALARALAPSPALMLFDEPFASLDHNLRVQLRQEVVAALKATATPAVFVTHDQRESLAIADRVAVMRAGRIVQLDTPVDVFHGPIDAFVGAFMGEATFLPIELSTTPPSTELGPVDLGGVDTSTACAMVRPDDVIFVPDAAGTAEIVATEYHGSAWLATARLRDGLTVLAASSHLDPPSLGQRGRLALVDGHRQVVVPRDER